MSKIFVEKFNKLFNNNSSIFLKEAEVPPTQAPQTQASQTQVPGQQPTNDKTQVQGSSSALISALKGIGVADPKIATIFNRIKQGNESSKLSTAEKNVIADIFISLIKTNNDSGLLKVFTALKNIGGK